MTDLDNRQTLVPTRERSSLTGSITVLSETGWMFRDEGLDRPGIQNGENGIRIRSMKINNMFGCFSGRISSSSDHILSSWHVQHHNVSSSTEYIPFHPADGYVHWSFRGIRGSCHPSGQFWSLQDISCFDMIDISNWRSNDSQAYWRNSYSSDTWSQSKPWLRDPVSIWSVDRHSIRPEIIPRRLEWPQWLSSQESDLSSLVCFCFDLK